MFLSSCGGDSDSQEELNNSESLQVAKSELDAIVSAGGTWLATFDILTSFNGELDTSKVSGDVSVDLTAFAIAPIYFSTQNEHNAVSKGLCSVNAPIELPSDAFDNDFDEGFLLGQLESKLNLKLDTSFCAGDAEIEELFYKYSEDNYSIEYYCGEEKVGGLSLERISDDSSFSQGNLNFTSDTYPDLDTSETSNGCGGLLEFDVIARSSANNMEQRSFGFDMSSINITADYLDSKIGLDFVFSSTLTLGEHEVTSLMGTILADDSSKVAISITSAEFGGTPSFPMHMEANSGSVTVTEITDQSARGTYNFTTDNGASFSGSFSFNYE